MKASTRKGEIAEFLQDMKQAIVDKTAGYTTLDLVPRPKNLSTLTKLGFVLDDVKNTILGLSVTDYCEGPIQDHSVKGDCWIFGKVILEGEVYIKLKIACFGSTNPLRVVRIISFHIAETSLCYPFPAQEE